MRRLRHLAILLTISILLSSCFPRIIYKIPELHYIALEPLPVVSFKVEETQMCLDTQGAQALYLREQLLKVHITQLESLIKTTNEQFGIK